MLSPSFFIGQIRVGSISDASVLNMGNNFPTHFESNKKQNQGFGSITGDNNSIEGIRALLNDPDFVDMLNQSEMGQLPEWLQEAVGGTEHVDIGDDEEDEQNTQDNQDAKGEAQDDQEEAQNEQSEQNNQHEQFTEDDLDYFE
ncbi:spore germination protein [Scopulibacillus cellulosilyticus]|uniref:Spore germination protein n=1 Tax=Scopulibacillus cellulosilyticus TaxID=2665665 RepID=A0ABW2Q243_9BACL